MTFNCGFEAEMHRNGPQVVAALHRRGACRDPRMHNYHCTCSACDPWGEWLFHPQSDCTVTGEMISAAIVFNSDRFHAATETLQAAAVEARGEPGYNAGCHVHVGHENMSDADKVRLSRLYIRYEEDLGNFASGRDVEVRGYNAPLNMRSIGSSSPFHGIYRYSPDEYLESWRARNGQPDWYRAPWLTGSHGNWIGYGPRTFEFRLWNSTIAAWRIHMYAGLSVAMCTAAMDPDLVVRQQDTRHFLSVLGPYMDAETLGYVARQLHHKAG